MRTILVADDHEWEVKGLITELKKRYKVKYVSDGRQATERIDKGEIDGAVLDWEMPPAGIYPLEAEQFYGDQVAKKARRSRPNIVLVLRSSIADKFVEELKPYKVFCHKKGDDNRRILRYLKQKLGE